MTAKWVAIFSFALLLTVGAGCAPESTEPTEETTPEVIELNLDSQPPAEGGSASGGDTMKTYTFPGALPAEQIENKQIRITTAKGDVVFELYPDTAPLAVSNFVYLSGEGYYDGLIFHRREEGFVIQGGDPLGNGRGGPGYRFEDELSDAYAYDRGIVAMANAGPNTNGSQFFIMLADYPLPKNYTIFGRVLEGMDVVDEIKVGDEMIKVTVEEKGS
jgi:cyclophilin family peptidyl-prolyl cis-trans isomerase